MRRLDTRGGGKREGKEKRNGEEREVGRKRRRGLPEGIRVLAGWRGAAALFEKKIK